MHGKYLIKPSVAVCSGALSNAWTVDYYTRTEEGWLLGCMVKVLRVAARQNPCQGGLSDSFLLAVEYKIGI